MAHRDSFAITRALSPMAIWKTEIGGQRIEVAWNDLDGSVSARHPIWTKGRWITDEENVSTPKRPRNEIDATEIAWRIVKKRKLATRSYRRLLEEVHRGGTTVIGLAQALDALPLPRTVEAVAVLAREGILLVSMPTEATSKVKPLHSDLEASIAATEQRAIAVDDELS